MIGIVGLATTLYDSFLPFLWVVQNFHCSSLLIFTRLASRGAHFGDASLFITYRNVGSHSFF
jgi:hypothetical protein